MARRLAVVTGASPSSIGFRTAQLLAAKPHCFRVVLACRNEALGRAAQRDIEQRDPDASVVFMHCDLASMASIRSFAAAVTALESSRAGGLSLLVANAGVGFGRDLERRETRDGFELRMGVNHLGHFLLTDLLRAELARAPSARVVVVSSALHDPGERGGAGAKPATLGDLSDLQLARPGAYDAALAYKNSKLANVLFAYELQRRLRAQGRGSVAVNAITPGFIPSSGLVRDAGPVPPWQPPRTKRNTDPRHTAACRSPGSPRRHPSRLPFRPLPFGVTATLGPPFSSAGVLGRFFLRYVLDGVLRQLGLVTFTRTLDEGARCAVLAATAPEAAEGGGYFELTRVRTPGFKGSAQSSSQRSRRR